MSTVTTTPKSIAPDPVRSLECFDCTVPLPAPLLVGSATVTHRSYAVVRVTAESGATGAAFAFSRGLPVAEIVQRSFAPVVIGADTAAHQLVRERIAGAFWPYAEGALFSAAVSAVDIALWDLAARRLAAPLADLLGRQRASVPMCAVVSYGGREGAELDALRAEVGGYLEQGFRAIKLVVGARSPEDDARRVAAVRELAGPEPLLVLDAFRSFPDVESALRRLTLLREHDIAFLEDPFPESLEALVLDLRRRSAVSIGLGETQGRSREHRRAIAAGIVDVLRADATVVGGVREFLASAALADAYGLKVSPHAHPEVHVHLGAAIPNLYAAGIEYMDPARGLDAFHRLLATQLEISGGHATVPSQPGLGLDFDWEAVARYSR
jgi:L-alanine-DL-glutamate epimerase-like enolase superfamily enzyme